MTWGAPPGLSGDDSVCLHCEHLADCQRSVRHGHEVQCETPDADKLAVRTNNPRPREYLDVLTPGVVFTSRQLSEWTGKGIHTVGSWCRDHVRFGDVRQLGTTSRTGNTKGDTAHIWQYIGFTPPRDGMIGLSPVTADSADRAAPGRGEEEEEA